MSREERCELNQSPLDFSSRVYPWLLNRLAEILVIPVIPAGIVICPEALFPQLTTVPSLFNARPKS
jgi:hypothetical protein